MYRLGQAGAYEDEVNKASRVAVPYSEPLSTGPSLPKPCNPKEWFPKAFQSSEKNRSQQAPNNILSGDRILVENFFLGEFNNFKGVWRLRRG